MLWKCFGDNCCVCMFSVSRLFGSGVLRVSVVVVWFMVGEVWML